jgi:hypothetical protein
MEIKMRNGNRVKSISGDENWELAALHRMGRSDLPPAETFRKKYLDIIANFNNL